MRLMGVKKSLSPKKGKPASARWLGCRFKPIYQPNLKNLNVERVCFSCVILNFSEKSRKKDV